MSRPAPQPPVLARGLIRAVCPARYSRLVLYDLEDEFHLLLRNGADARHWYWRHALASLGPLILTEMRHTNWPLFSLVLLAVCAGPAVLLNAAWSAVLSQVPFKASDVRGADFLAIELAITFLLALPAGTACTFRGLVVAVPTACCFVLAGQAAACGVAPSWFPLAMLACVAVALISGACIAGWKRRHQITRSNGENA